MQKEEWSSPGERPLKPQGHLNCITSLIRTQQGGERGLSEGENGTQGLHFMWWCLGNNTDRYLTDLLDSAIRIYGEN